tara:strand:- start:343 stop:594 length:252 start_codon:yes stop_codon:yes gene_type:complete
MILMGRKKGNNSVVAAIRDKMSGKGMSDEDLKYKPESQQDEDGEAMALEHAAKGIVEAIQAGNVKEVEHSLKAFIELCLKNKE